MGLPLEQWRGGEAESGGEKEASAGCRTPSSSKARAAGDCPAAPRKRRAAPGAVSQQRNKEDYYAGDDVEAFFAANNL